MLTFEKYVKIPPEMQLLRKRNAEKDAEEETFNPWIITDLDYFLKGNPFCRS